MISSFILKLLDEAVLPAVIVFCVKLGGLIVLARIFHAVIYIQSNRLVFEKFSDLVIANDISNLLLLLTLLLGTGWVLIRLHFFHDSHLSPLLLPKILESDLEFIVSTSFDLFHQIFVWLSLGFLIVAALLVQVLFNLTSPLILALALVEEIFFIVLTVIDLEREAGIHKTEQPSVWVWEESSEKTAPVGRNVSL